MNKKILLSLLIIGIIASVASAGTWAYFSDIESTATNTITAGSLKIGAVTSETVIFPTNTTIKPGDTLSKGQQVTNDGNVAGDLYVKINPSTTALLDHVSLTVKGGDEKPVELTKDGKYVKVGSMNANGNLYLTFDCTMPTTEYNCQKLATEFKVDLLLIQQGITKPDLDALAKQGNAP